MNINLGGILGLFLGLGLGLLFSLPLDQGNPDSFGRAGKFVGFGLAVGAFAGNVAWAHFFDKNKRK
jgi:hypothetical protein